MRVAAVPFYGYALWVCCPLAGDRPFFCGCWTPGDTRWVAWEYCVKPGRETRLWVSAGGGGGHVVVGGDDVLQEPWGVHGRWTVVPTRAWRALVIAPDGW